METDLRNDLVTVITPTYNSQNYILDAINSVKN